MFSEKREVGDLKQPKKLKGEKMKKLATVFLAAAFIMAIHVPAFAADWNLYGSARTLTFWTDQSEERGDRTDLGHSLAGTSRVGAIVQSGDVGGRFEYGYTGAPGDGSATVRLLYGTFDIGGGQVLAGRFYSPWSLDHLISNQAYGDAVMVHHLPYAGRQNMIQYSQGGFKFALVEPRDPVPGEVMLPQFHVGYGMAMQDMRFNVTGKFQTYDLDDGLDAGGGDTLNAWGVAASVRLDQLNPVYLRFAGFYAVNPSHFGEALRVNGVADVTDVNDVEDTDVWGLTAIVGTNVNGIGLELGVGYQEADNDNWAEKDDAMTIYAQASIPLTESGNAFIIPEIGYIDYMDDNLGNDEGDDTYFGLKTQINF